MNRSLVILVEVVLIAVIWWLLWLINQPAQFTFNFSGFDRIEAAGLALTVGSLAAAAVWGANRRGLATTVVLAVGALGVATVVGTARLLTVPTAVDLLARAAWLGSAAAALVAVDGARTIPRRRIAAVGATAVAAGIAGIGPLGAPVVQSQVAARSALALHLVALVACVLAFAVPLVRRPAWWRDPLVVVSLTWAVTASIERGLHLLPASAYWNEQHNTYEPWATVATMFLPLLATGGIVVALGWLLAVRPRAERLANGLLVVPDRDPLSVLRDDLAAWAGDPTLQIAYADGPDHWVSPSGETVVLDPDYDRATTTITLCGEPVGLLDHDISLVDAPEALRAAAELAGVALEANQLLARSEAHVVEARRLGERLLSADVTTRQQVLTELETGPIARLQECIDLVEFGAPLADIVQPLRATTADVRMLSHGLYPPELVEGGLDAVLPSHNGVPTRRFPLAVEITAFLLAVNDPECTFDDVGTALLVRRTTGVSDPSIWDRIDVLGGVVDGAVVSLPTETS